MSRNLRPIAALVLLVAGGIEIEAGGQRTVTAAAAWIEAPAAGATSANAYVSVDNPTMYEVYVVSATSAAAEKIEIRGAGADAATTEVSVPAYGSVELKPGGTRLVLTGLKRPLKAGEKVELTLTTDSGVVLTVTADVRAAKAAPLIRSRALAGSCRQRGDRALPPPLARSCRGRVGGSLVELRLRSTPSSFKPAARLPA